MLCEIEIERIAREHEDGAAEMTPAEQQIRAALERGPIPGPWRVERMIGHCITDVVTDHPSWQAGSCGNLVADVSFADGHPEQRFDQTAAYIAACSPENVAALLAELDRLRARLEKVPEHPIDGIEARDATIRLQDAEIDRLNAEITMLMQWQPK